MVRSPTTSPARFGGAAEKSSDITIGCDMPSPRPRTNASAISTPTSRKSGYAAYTMHATPSATATSVHSRVRRTSVGRASRTTKVAAANAPSSTPIALADRPSVVP